MSKIITGVNGKEYTTGTNFNLRLANQNNSGLKNNYPHDYQSGWSHNFED